MHAERALDIDHQTLKEAGMGAGPIVALAKAKSELQFKRAKIADRERLSDLVKPTAPTPTLIIAVNGIDIIGKGDLRGQIDHANKSVIEAAPIEALSFAGLSK